MQNFIFIVKLIVAIISNCFVSSQYKIAQIDTFDTKPEIAKRLKEFETAFEYPFNDTEQFRIQHGANGDYFSFFKKLGKPYCFIAVSKNDKTTIKIVDGKQKEFKQNKNEIAAVGCCVLRELKTNEGKLKNAWYICDLKVNEKFQGEHLPTTIVKKVALPRFFQCPRGFAICMNPPKGQPKAASIFKKHGPIKSLDTKILNLYMQNLEQINKNKDNIKQALIKNGYMKKNEKLEYVSTTGSKDYQIFDKTKENSRTWKLFHIKPGKQETEAKEDGDYMICSVDGTQLDNDLKKIIGSPTSTAQIVSYSMKDFDFNFLTTDQI